MQRCTYFFFCPGNKMKRLKVRIIDCDNRSVSFVISKRYNRTQIAVEYCDELTSSDDRSYLADPSLRRSRFFTVSLSTSWWDKARKQGWKIIIRSYSAYLCREIVPKYISIREHWNKLFLKQIPVSSWSWKLFPLSFFLFRIVYRWHAN